MGATAKEASAKAEPIVVYQSTNMEGATFALSPESREFLEERFHDKLRLLPRIFIAVSRDTRDDFERIHGNLKPHLLSLLTGLTDEVTKTLQVEFRDAVTDLPL
jgi:hypothetical protein